MAKESRNKYLFKNTAFFAIGNFGTKMINFFMVPLYTYALSTAEYGTINTIISICTILIPFTMCNIGESIRRYLMDENANESGIQFAELIWFSVGIFFGIIIYAILSFMPGYQEYALEMCLYTLSIAFVQTCQDYLRGKEMLALYTISSLLQTLMIAGFNILFLVNLKHGIHGYFRSYIIAYFLCGIFAFVAGGQIRALKSVKMDKKLFFEMSKFSLTLVPNSIMWWITDASDKIMVTYFISKAANGIYSISTKLPTILSTMNHILLLAWQYSAVKESDSEDRVAYNNKMMRVYMVTTSIVGAFLLLINKPFTYIYVSPEYRGAWIYTPFLIMSAMISTINTFVGTSYYVAKDMKGYVRSSMIGAFINIILNLTLIPTIGISGAAFATCVSYFVQLLYRSFDTQKYLPMEIWSPFCIKLMLITLAMVFATYLGGALSYVLLMAGMLLILWVTREYYVGILKMLLKRIRK